MQAAGKRFVASHPKEFTGSLSVVARSLNPANKLTLLAYWQYTHPGDDLQRLNTWRSKLWFVLNEALQAADVAYTIPPQAPPLKAGALMGALQAGPPGAPAVMFDANVADTLRAGMR